MWRDRWKFYNPEVAKKMDRRRLDIIITNCWECPYKVYRVGAFYCWHPKFDGIDKKLPDPVGITRIVIPDWCPIPTDVLT